MNRAQRRHRRDGTAATQAGFAERTTEEQLGTMEALLEEARASAYEAINSHHRDFLSIRVYAQDPLDEVATLNDKYEAVRSRVAGEGPTSSQLARLDSIGRALRAIVRLAKTHANLKDIDDQILHGDIAVAASLIAEAGGLLHELESDAPRLVSAQPVDVLQAQYLKKRAALRAELDYLTAEMYRFGDAGTVHELTVSYCVAVNYDGVPYENAVTLSDLFFALAQLGLAQDMADRLVASLSSRWLAPLLRNPSEVLSVTRVRLFATMSIGAFSSGRRGAGPPALPAAAATRQLLEAHCEALRSQWTTVLRFVRDEVFHDVNVEEDHADLYAYVGARLWETVWPLVREELLVPLVPDDIDGITDTQCLVPLMELEEAWLELGLISADALFVKDATRSLLQTYIGKRRRDLLTTVATILASEDANTVVVGGEGPVIDVLGDYSAAAANGKQGSAGKKGSSKAKGLSLGADADADMDGDGSLALARCSISVQAQTLVEFARETIGFTQSDDGKTAALYFHAVRDAFALYRCLMPSKWATELVVSARRAFVMHNDCEFICHHLAALGHRYRDSWPPALKATATFVDVIVAYRALARSCLTPLLNRVRDQITQALGPWTHARWLRDRLVDAEHGISTMLAGSEDAERRLAMACGAVSQTAHIAAAHLPRATHLRVVGLLVDAVAGHAVRRLQEVESASDSAARALIRLVEPVLSLEELFAAARPRDGPARRAAPAARFAAEWDPLQAQIRRLSSMSAHRIMPRDVN
ncbi:ribosome biogenesis protein ytm1 [Coemansia biformis]|uniref:Ribosome biogenesis protein ytm1 n=1 Tax=Coemansia biformis TaxID=1286918 RepID=A0A9W8D0T6_9FUNG|nr:ribosome biogenesis protein ytm1 [Coemansia biformis]